MRRILPALFVAAWLTGAAAAAADVKLVLKYQPETTSTTQAETSTKQILTLAGMDLESDVSQFVVSTSTIGKRKPDGTLAVVEKIDKLQSNLSLPGGLKLAFDSGDPDKKAENALLEPLLDVFRVLAKTKTTTLLDKDNHIQAIEFSDNPADKVGDDYKSQFDPEKRKKSAESERNILSDKPVKPGDSWTHTSESDLGAGQILTIETRYEYLGTAEKGGKTFDKISAKSTTVTYAMDPGSSSPLKIKSSELKITSSEGTILFDRDKGAVVESVSKVKIEGDLKAEINGMELPGKLSLTIESKSALQP